MLRKAREVASDPDFIDWLNRKAAPVVRRNATNFFRDNGDQPPPLPLIEFEISPLTEKVLLTNKPGEIRSAEWLPNRPTPAVSLFGSVRRIHPHQLAQLMEQTHQRDYPDFSEDEFWKLVEQNNGFPEGQGAIHGIAKAGVIAHAFALLESSKFNETQKADRAILIANRALAEICNDF